jgi:hypothetical protein
MTNGEYRDVLLHTEVENKNQDKIIKVFDQLENDLFLGKEEVQPIKWHQISRIFRLAKGFIEVVLIIWPYIKMIIKLLK